MAQTLEEVPC